jgi:hypothetical protein
LHFMLAASLHFAIQHLDLVVSATADVEQTRMYIELDRPRRLMFTMFVPRYSTSPDRITLKSCQSSVVAN